MHRILGCNSTAKTFTVFYPNINDAITLERLMKCAISAFDWLSECEPSTEHLTFNIRDGPKFFYKLQQYFSAKCRIINEIVFQMLCKPKNECIT